VSRSKGETALVAAALEYLHGRGIPCWRVNAGLQFVGRSVIRGAPNGTPDIIGWDPGNGRMFGLEAKMPGKMLSEDQNRWARFAAANGFKYWMFCSMETIEIVANECSGYACPAAVLTIFGPHTKEKAAFRNAPKGRNADETPTTKPTVARVRKSRASK
jgi:hypothetical protein